jgi:hypothetical protein
MTVPFRKPEKRLPCRQNWKSTGTDYAEVPILPNPNRRNFDKAGNSQVRQIGKGLIFQIQGGQQMAFSVEKSVFGWKIILLYMYFIT